MILTKELLQYIQQEYLTKTVEVCGNIIDVDENGVLYDVVIGSLDDAGRPLCRVLKYSNVNFHTHPNGHKAYPSSEDIISLMKMKKVRIDKEVVFTSWGIWVISSRKKDDFSSEEKTLYTLKKLEKHGHSLYHKTNRGRLQITEENKDELFRNIREFIYNLSNEFRVFGLSIEFYPWDIPYLINL